MEITAALLTAVMGVLVSLVASLLTKFISDKSLNRKSKIKIGGVEIQLSKSADESTRRILDKVQELQESPQVFLSYSFQDKSFAHTLANDLREQGIKVWLADEQLKVGDKIIDTIREGISSSQWVVVVLSENSSQSDFVSKELVLAHDEEKKRDRPFILPVVISEIRLPIQLQDKQYADFRGNYNLGLDKILARVKPSAKRAYIQNQSRIMKTTNAAPEALQPKVHLTGKVNKTTIAGAILDIGQKVPGVVHISQLKKDPVNRVEDVVQVGQTVDVWVRRVRDDRVELTMVEPVELEWREMEAGMVVKGKVERLETYGAFVNIGAERPGLVHVSEISHDYVKNPSEVLKVGDEVEAKVLDVDRRKKQIRLSIKAVTPKPGEVLTEVNKEEPRKGRGRKSKKETEEAVPEEPKEPELTAFQIAFQLAQERSGKTSEVKNRKSKSRHSMERKDIYEQTLNNHITEK